VRFLLDNNLSQRLADGLRGAGHDVVHVRDVGLAAAEDEMVLACACDNDRILVSADTDFGGILARSGAARPSLILFRRDTGRRPATQVALLTANLEQIAAALKSGSVVVLTDRLVRIRALPLLP
jgi:predicted nuclease of predicted toxin-antitoxin system